LQPLKQPGAVFGVDPLILAIEHSSRFNDKKFIDTFESHLEKHPSIKPYFYSKIVQYGSGYSVDFCKTYGLSPQGIEYILAAREIDVPVIDNQEVFKNFLHQQKEGRLTKAILTENVFTGVKTTSHILSTSVFAVACLKTTNQSYFYVYDPAANEIDKAFFQDYFDRSVIVFYPSESRMRYGDSQGGDDFVYALHDLSLIDKYPPPLEFGIKYALHTTSLLRRLSVFYPTIPVESEKFELAAEFSHFNVSEYKKDLFRDIAILDLSEEAAMGSRLA